MTCEQNTTHPILDVRNLRKTYRLGRPSLRGLLRLSSRKEREMVIALDNLSFAVLAGQAVGLVGCNGSGKTTLLKILARITVPTSGEAILRGEVGALLDVAAGFHDELTGRENAELAAAIHGRRLSRADIEAIGAMAQVERFLDTPMRRYSMGMFQRLGIATAARTKAQLLLVDESFSAVDGAFRSFGLRALRRTVDHGGAMLLVSHQLDLIEQNTERCLWLERGRLQLDGSTTEVLAAYREHLRTSEPEDRDGVEEP
ncbi:MAG: ATP-binding cassette domain-containing protein [Myxococcota bacterium]|jgi:lipopolysaccharide transport system ATP-binding protein|nr:ATP-binding cassette domain-containing protein [Myxococcota bacterium]